MEESNTPVANATDKNGGEQTLTESDMKANEQEAGKRPHRVLGIILSLVVLALLLGAVVMGVAYYLNTPPSKTGAAVQFAVRKGESLDSVAARLAHDHLIRSSLLMKVVGRLSHTSGDVQAGYYAIRPTMSTISVHNMLIDGKQILVRVTIPEGYTLRQIAHRVQEAGITSTNDFIAAASNESLLARYHIPAHDAQGYLFPDTYLFPKDYPARDVVAHMLETFYARLKTVDPEYHRLTPKELFAKVTMASIVEREYMSPDEAPLIASVFYNRLRAHMRLESCATVVYVMTEQDGLPHPDRLYYKDLDRKSPYNTYLHAGLPPGPISNPGVTALKAAFFPAKTHYWYFVLKSEGATHHHFSTSLKDHDRATVYYLKTLNTRS